MIPESTQLITLATRLMNETGCDWDISWQRTKEMNPALWAKVEGAKRPIVMLGNERAIREEAAAQYKQGQARKLFCANVKAAVERYGSTWESEWNRARLQFVTLYNEAYSTPVFSPGMKALLSLPADVSQEEAAAGWIGNGKQLGTRNAAAVWAAMVRFWTEKMPSKGADQIVSYCIEKYGPLAREAGIIAAE